MVGEVKRGKLKVSDIEDLVEIGKTVRPHRVAFISPMKPSKQNVGKLKAAAEELSAFGVWVDYFRLRVCLNVNSSGDQGASPRVMTKSFFKERLADELRPVQMRPSAQRILIGKRDLLTFDQRVFQVLQLVV
jgi:hypothetical protein